MTVNRVTYSGEMDNLLPALDLALRDIGARPVTINGWITNDAGLHLGHLYNPERGQDWNLLPCGLAIKATEQLVRGWLDWAEYPDPPDTDGSTEKGVELDNVSAFSMATYEVLVVRPHWVVYGK